MTRSGGELVPASWAEAISKIRQNLTGKKALVLVGADLTNEEAHAIQQFVSKELPSAIVYSFSDESIRTSKQDGAEDQLLRMKSKVANLRGLEALGYSPCPESLPRADVALVFRGGRAVLPNFSGMEVFGIGVFTKEEASSFSGVLPGTSFAEKSGTFTNSQNMKQSIKRALRPLGQSKQTGEILMTWMNLGSKSGAA
jgi:predicted molibdopterin-dependent oxidoreductase YjgC